MKSHHTLVTKTPISDSSEVNSGSDHAIPIPLRFRILMVIKEENNGFSIRNISRI